MGVFVVVKKGWLGGVRVGKRARGSFKFQEFGYCFLIFGCHEEEGVNHNKFDPKKN
jgi:hypothetical protein